jgi:hypothetical protein
MQLRLHPDEGKRSPIKRRAFARQAGAPNGARGVPPLARRATFSRENTR